MPGCQFDDGECWSAVGANECPEESKKAIKVEATFTFGGENKASAKTAPATPKFERKVVNVIPREREGDKIDPLSRYVNDDDI